MTDGVTTSKVAAPTLMELYFQYVEQTESPLIFHRWCFISCIAAFLGRRVWLPFGHLRTYPNMYVMIVGLPGSRKSTAIKLSKSVLSAAGYRSYAADKTTKEKFILDLAGESYDAADEKSGRRSTLSARDVLQNLDLDDSKSTHDGIPKEVFVVADEFNEFAGSGNLDFLSFLGSLWDWDDPHDGYKHRLKNSKSVNIYQPTINVLGGNTYTGLAETFPTTSLGQGFLSRLIFVHSEPSGKKITEPPEPPQEIRVQIQEGFARIAETVQGAATLTPKAYRALDTIYRTWPDLEDYRFNHYNTRRFTHLRKLCMVVAATRYTTVIDEQDVIFANTLLTFTELEMPKALGEFGKNKNSEATQNLMTALYNTKHPMTFEELYKIVSRDIDGRSSLAKMLESLVQTGKVQLTTVPGKADKRFLPVVKAPDENRPYVNFALLKEWKGKMT